MSEDPKYLKDLRVADLKQELEKRGLQTSGVKAILADRLKAAIKEEGFDPEEFDFNAQTNAENEGGEHAEASTSDNVEKEEKYKAENDNQDEEEEIEDRDGDDQKSEEEQEQEENEQESQEDNENCEDVEDENKEEEMEEASNDNENKNDIGTNDETLEDESMNAEETEDKLEDSIQEEKIENNTVEEATSKNEDKEPDEDSLNLMVGDEDNLFADEEKMNGAPSSPPRPETAPVKHPFTSKDTISLSSRVDKAPSENSSMRVNPDESQSVASHDSGDALMNQQSESGGSKAGSKNGDDMDKIRNLWVSGLSATTKAADLKTVFSAYGKVAGAKIVTSSRAPGARCFGYVTMASPQEADACIDKLNKSELGGSLIMVEKATADNGPHRRKDDHRDRGKSASRTSDSRATSARRSDRREDSSRKSGSTSRSSRSHHREPAYSGRHHDLASRSGASHNRPLHDSHHSSNRSTDLRRDDRRSAGRSGGSDRDRRSGPILTLNQIKDQRKREQEREEERRRRDRERRREEDDERRRKEAHRRQQEAEEKLRLEREELKRERERLEREKKEILELERERQRAERRRLERDKAELEKLKRSQSMVGSSSSSSRMDDRRVAPKRPADDRDSYHLDRKRERGGREDMSGSSNQSASGMLSRRPDRMPQSSSRYDRPSGRDLDPPGLSSSRGMSDFGGPMGSGSSRDAPRDEGRSRGGGDRWGSRDGPGSSSSRDMGMSRDRDRMGGPPPGAREGSRAGDRDGGRFRDRDSGMGASSSGRVDRGGGDHHRMDGGGQNYRGERSSHHPSSSGRGGGSRGGPPGAYEGRSGGASSGSHHHGSSGGRPRSPFSSSSSGWSSKGGAGPGGRGMSGSGGGGSSYMGGAGGSSAPLNSDWRVEMDSGTGMRGAGGLAGGLPPGLLESASAGLPGLGLQGFGGGGAGGPSWGNSLSMQTKQLQAAAGSLMANLTGSASGLLLPPGGRNDRFDGYSNNKSNMNQRRY